MTRKTQKTYEHCLRYVHENVFSLRCESIITDYEIAMRQALKEVVPGIKLLGCWFHFAQAIRRKVASICELFELVRTNDKIRHVYYKIICIALLPFEKIERTFNELALEGLELTKHFTPFVKYFRNQWLKRVGAKNFSVFLEEQRTTCSAEGYNGKLGKKFRSHPNFFVFVESLQHEELAKSNALEQHINGARQTQPKKEYRERASQIRNEWNKFTIPKQTNAQLFLNRIANTKNRMFPKQFERFEDIVAYADETEEVLDEVCSERNEANHTNQPNSRNCKTKKATTTTSDDTTREEKQPNSKALKIHTKDISTKAKTTKSNVPKISNQIQLEESAKRMTRSQSRFSSNTQN